jgi:hypothetical protein
MCPRPIRNKPVGGTVPGFEKAWESNREVDQEVDWAKKAALFAASQQPRAFINAGA